MLVLRILTGIRRIGHTGTLDPFATGVLILAQDATKLIAHLPSAKTIPMYPTTGYVNGNSRSDRGNRSGKNGAFRLSAILIQQSLCDFIGDVEQTPTKVFDIKIIGRRLYEYARAGQDVDIPSRIVNIDTLSILSEFEGTSLCSNQVALDICCSKGTYVRSLGLWTWLSRLEQ